MSKVLVVDDNPAVRRALTLMLQLAGIPATGVATPAEALALVEREPIDLVIQDMNFTQATTSGEEGIALFEGLRALDADLPIVLLTAWTQLDVAVKLVKRGAADYLAKPWDDERLVASVRNLLELRQARGEQRRTAWTRARARRELSAAYDLCDLVYASEAMHNVATLACRVARAEVPVLITGPSGAGKEKIAEIVQRNSALREQPFVRVNVGALPRELIGAELFGAEAGAYTGATRARPGRFEAADGGTLFLDEIGTLPAEGQVKLLRVLQSGEFERLGSTHTRKVRIRLISATNADLRAAIAAGSFREDLYYRLNLIEIALPALADRSDDIAPLAQAFLDRSHTLSVAALDALGAYAWPGNVRELENCMRRACLLANASEITPADLGLPMANLSGDAAMAEDREAIERALARHGGTIAAAARDLGLTRQALYRRLEKHGIAPAPAPPAA